MAAASHGDPNLIHRKNERFSRVIAPGLLQLQGFTALFGWMPHHKINVRFETALQVPSEAVYRFDNPNQISLIDKNITFSVATVEQSGQLPTATNASTSFIYKFLDQPLQHAPNWNEFGAVPISLTQQLFPNLNESLTKQLSTIGVSANALVKALDSDQEFLPDLFFPPVRGYGNTAIMESQINLYMGETSQQDLSQVELAIHQPFSLNEKELSVTVSETSNLFQLQMTLTKISTRVFQRLLK